MKYLFIIILLVIAAYNVYEVYRYGDDLRCNAYNPCQDYEVIK